METKPATPLEFRYENDVKILRIYFDTPTFDRITKDERAKFEVILSTVGRLSSYLAIWLQITFKMGHLCKITLTTKVYHLKGKSKVIFTTNDFPPKDMIFQVALWDS